MCMCSTFKEYLFVIILSITLYHILIMNIADPMAKNGLLFVSNVSKAQNVCQKASKYVKKTLYINFNDNSVNNSSLISKEIVDLYAKATSQCINLDVRLMLKPYNTMKNIKTNKPIDVLLYDSDLSKEVENIKKSVMTLNPGCKVHSIDFSETSKPNAPSKEEPVKKYEYVALGGTFDRLHNGHKILLSEAVLRSTKHLTVGVTDVNMIQSKKLWELIEPVQQRIKSVLDFLTDINPDLEYHVFPLKDLYGPTKDDPKFQMIVVSEETHKGAIKINEKRVENGLKPMDVYTIGMAEDSHPQKSEEEEQKVSSSNQRMRLLGTLLRPPVPNPNIPDWPYIIGLAGGIASGKSSIAEKLQRKGAGLVNCDIIAHELYRPGLPLNSTIAETFGKHIITESGEVDRKKLGSIVFSDKEQLEKLNNITWPAVLEEAKRRAQELGSRHRVVVMEAAVMVRAGWFRSCHQLWAVIIPPEEAIKRLQKRNNLTEEEARQRVAAQPTNAEQIASANVVFSPYWSYEYTQAQVDRAWLDLQEYLDART